SMEQTLLIGDHVFVNRVQFSPPSRWIGPIVPYRNIRHGDIVVFLSPATPGLYVVKRVIGTPGDKIHLRHGEVYRNGEKLNEPYVIHSLGDEVPYRDDFPAASPEYSNASPTPEWQVSMRQYVQGDDLVVPAESYFMMGDNRDVSYDSRFWGFVPRDNVIGRPMFIYWSFETPPISTPALPRENGRDSWRMWSCISLTKHAGGVLSGWCDEAVSVQAQSGCSDHPRAGVSFCLPARRERTSYAD